MRLSRRRFLEGSAALSAGVAVKPSLAAAAACADGTPSAAADADTGRASGAAADGAAADVAGADDDVEARAKAKCGDSSLRSE